MLIPLGGPLGRVELRRQAEGAKVVATCGCGCPSVWLRWFLSALQGSVRPRRPTATRVTSRLPRYSAWGPAPQVTLHVVSGRMFELEIWEARLASGASGSVQTPAQVAGAAIWTRRLRENCGKHSRPPAGGDVLHSEVSWRRIVIFLAGLLAVAAVVFAVVRSENSPTYTVDDVRRLSTTRVHDQGGEPTSRGQHARQCPSQS
jgi:hypothetical protein